MIGMNTRMIDSPPGIIYHTPVRDLFKPDPSAKVWYVGENFPESVSVKVIKREEGEVEVVDQILGTFDSPAPRSLFDLGFSAIYCFCAKIEVNYDF